MLSRIQQTLLISLIALSLSACRRNATVNLDTSHASGTNHPVRVSAEEADAAEPAIAAAPDGSVYVAWVNHGPKSEADVMVAHFNADGQLQGSAVRVNSQPGTATAWRGDAPTIVVAPDDTVYVGWTARVPSDSGHATDLCLSSSRDRGRTFGAPVKVNDDTRPAVHGMHSLAAGNGGRIYVAWLDERNITPLPMKDPKMDPSIKGHHMESNRELFFASSTDGGHTFAANQRVATNVCPCCKTALVISANDQLYLSWRQVLPGDLRHIAVASSSNQGKTFAAPKIVSDDQWVLSGCPVSGPSLSVDKVGVLSVLWYSAGTNGKTGLYWSQSADHGATFSARKLVAAGPTKGSPVLLAQNGTVTSVWEGNEGGKSVVLTANFQGSASAADNSVVADTGELPAASFTARSRYVAYLTNEQRRVIWLVRTSLETAGH